MSLFSPNYGAAQTHITELMAEREDFLAANKAQAARIANLESELATITEQVCPYTVQTAVYQVHAGR